MKKLNQLMLLLTCLCVVAVGAVQRDGRLLGHDLAATGDTSRAAAASPMATLPDGTTVINTTSLAQGVSGYGGRVPLEIRLKGGRVEKVVALANSETPEFFQVASSLLTRWDGKTPDEALQMRVDAVSGATLSSRGIIGNVRAGLRYAAGNAAAAPAPQGAGPGAKGLVGLVVVLMAAVVPLFCHDRRYLTFQLCLNVAVLGLWCGTFLSWSLFVSFMSGGIDVWASLVPIVMLVTAFVYPLFGQKGYYCAHVCPFGSMQDLAGRANRRHKWRLAPATVRRLGHFRQLLFAVLMVLMLTGVSSDWMGYELFTAFIFKSASAVVIALAAVVVVLAAFVPRPYCRFVCPTGTLLKLSQDQR